MKPVGPALGLAGLAIGLAAGVAVGFITDYYCSKHKPPVDSVVAQSATGPATNIIAGLGVGMRSTAIPVLCIAVAIYALSNIMNSIWKGVRWGTTFKYVVDGIVYGLVTGGTFGWLWPKAM